MEVCSRRSRCGDSRKEIISRFRTTTEAHLDARHQLARSQKPLFIGESGAPGGTRTLDLLVRRKARRSELKIYLVRLASLTNR
jgi:hypothetical protein